MSDICFNVRYFGAKGDGSTDDTVAFEKALSAASTDCGTVFVPMGKYMINPIKIPSHITIRGNASWGYSAYGYGNNKVLNDEPVDKEISGNTVILPISANSLGLFDMSGTIGTTIVGISLDGLFKGQNFHGIYALGNLKEQGIVFEDIRISHFSGAGIRLQNVSGFALRRSLIIRNQSHALDCSQSENGVIIDNQLAYNLGAGLYAYHENDDGTISGTKDLLITANRIEGGYPGGIYVWNTSGCSITGNSFDGCRGAAITMINCTFCSLTGNMSRVHGRTSERDENCHYRIENATGVTISGNTLWCWYKLILGRNSVSTGPFFGMILKDLTDSIVTGNAMNECCSEELLHSVGEHKNSIISGNSGSVYSLST